jgi:hypothetical protein
MSHDLNLDAILSHSEAAYDFIRKDPCVDGVGLPLSVREHFNFDTPALIGAVKRLAGELASTRQKLAQLHAESVSAR